MGKYYVRCPYCRIRAVRTGKKLKEVQDINGNWIYLREYKCPKCGCLFIHSPFHSCIWYGSIEQIKQ
jgi:DNA-directed RNA polymerase subunit RPC12/RpoP